MAGKKPVVPSSGSVQPSTGAPSQVDGLTRYVVIGSRWRNKETGHLATVTGFTARPSDAAIIVSLRYDGQSFPVDSSWALKRWTQLFVPTVTVADVPGLSTADQTDEAVTSHQIERDKCQRCGKPCIYAFCPECNGAVGEGY